VEERDPETYAIIGAAMDVHRVLGSGFLESVYQEALAIEFSERGIAYQREPAIVISYKGYSLSSCYRPDFIAFESVIVELKALDALTTREQAQIINYLKASDISRGLLINFGQSSLQHRRFIRSDTPSSFLS
tara:strand:- start:93 stop:488 length:396 start_codon:yes stop_codon:yes gene_type:complete